MHHANPPRLPPGIVQTDPPDEESRHGRELGTRAKVTWSWLKSKFKGMPAEPEHDRDYWNGKWGRLYILVRPFDADGKWLDGLRQEFTSDALRDSERYGIMLLHEHPEVDGFWIDGSLDKYWTEAGQRRDLRIISLGRYERARQAPNPRRTGASFGEEKTGVEREAGGRFRAVPKCDFCGKPITGEHFSDPRVCGGGDGPGFFLCDRKRCSDKRERYEQEHGLQALGEHYVAQRTANEGLTTNGRHSTHRTVVEYAVQEMFKGKSPKVAAENTARKLNGGTNMFIDVTNETDIDPTELEEALWQNMADYAVRGSRPGDEVGAARGALMHFNQWQWGKPLKLKMEQKLLAHMQTRTTPIHTPNTSLYYVWVLSPSGDPLSGEGPYGPYDLESGKTFARIAATEGEHDRAVSRGLDPQSPSFAVVRHYRRGTGERVP